jgi:hypothetical protein
MFNFLEKLRAKPDKTKKQMAFLVALSVCGIIFVVWLTVILPDFRNTETKQAQATALTPGLISTFSDTFSSGIQSIGSTFSELKTTLSSVTSKK